MLSNRDLDMEKTRLFHRLSQRIQDERVIEAMENVPREMFVPAASRSSAYEDTPLPIQKGQTISQPFIVAMMTKALELTGKERVLEIGTGSGYQAAILAQLANQVISVERHQELIDFAFYFGVQNHITFGAPSNDDVQAVYDLPGAGWTSYNETQFTEASISAAAFDAIGSQHAFPYFPGGEDDINQLEIGDVVFFKTTKDKRGYIKVNDFNWKGDHINIDVKIEL